MPYLGTSPASELANLDINGQKFILDADADTHITADTDDQIDISIAGADDFQFTANTFTLASGSEMVQTDGEYFLGDTANANITLGMTVNQAAADNEIISLKSSDVAHGVTDRAETDTFGFAKKAVAATGGFHLEGITEATIGLMLVGSGPTATTSKTINGDSFVQVQGHLTSSTDTTTASANANIFSIRTDRGSVETIFIVDEDGDIFNDGTVTAYDDIDDAAMVRKFDLYRSDEGAGIVQSEFDEWVCKNGPSLEDLRIVGQMTEEEKARGDRPLINITQLQRLHNGAIWQEYQRTNIIAELLDNMLPGFGAELSKRLAEAKMPSLPALKENTLTAS